jgi:LysR family transcriptional activator of dmlA
VRSEGNPRIYAEKHRWVGTPSDHKSPDADIYAVYAERHRTSLRVNALVDFVAAALRQ